MTTLVSTSGKKRVNITNNNGVFNACFVQVTPVIMNGAKVTDNEQLIEMKSYKSLKMAEKWANKMLN